MSKITVLPYEAPYCSAGGRPFLRVEHDGDKKYITLTFEELDKFELKEEIQNGKHL